MGSGAGLRTLAWEEVSVLVGVQGQSITSRGYSQRAGRNKMGKPAFDMKAIGGPKYPNKRKKGLGRGSRREGNGLGGREGEGWMKEEKGNLSGHNRGIPL